MKTHRNTFFVILYNEKHTHASSILCLQAPLNLPHWAFKFLLRTSCCSPAVEGGSCRNIKSCTFCKCHFPFGVAATLLPLSGFFWLISANCFYHRTHLKRKRLDGNPAYRHLLRFGEVVQREHLFILT